MERGDGDEILFEMAEALSKRGDEDLVQLILSRITDPLLIRELNQPGMPPSTEQEQDARQDARNIAWQEAQSGEFVSAAARLEEAECDCQVVAFVREQSGDLESAARAVQKLRLFCKRKCRHGGVGDTCCIDGRYTNSFEIRQSCPR